MNINTYVEHFVTYRLYKFSNMDLFAYHYTQTIIRRRSLDNVQMAFPYTEFRLLQSWSIILVGIDLFLPTTSTISLQIVSLTPSIAFTFSSTSSSLALSLIIISALRSIVCSPILLPTCVTS